MTEENVNDPGFRITTRPIENVYETILIFNERPKLMLQIVNQPVSFRSHSGGSHIHDTGNAQADTSNTAHEPKQKQHIRDKSDVFGAWIKKNGVSLKDSIVNALGNKGLLDFLDEQFPITRYIERIQPYDSFPGILPYDAYLPHLRRSVLDLARLQYVYTILCSVTAALAREAYYTQLDPNNLSWDDLVHELSTWVEGLKKSNEWALKSDIVHMAALASHLYVNVTVPNKTSLKAMHVQKCGLEANSLTNSNFGHLLAAYAFWNAPLHVVSNLEKRNNIPMEKTYFSEKEKLFILKLELGEDDGMQNHGVCWSISVVAGSKREHFFDLEDVMIPGTHLKRLEKTREDEQNGGVHEPYKSDGYWCNQYDCTNECHGRFKFEAKSLISVKLNCTDEIRIRLNVPYESIDGVKMKKATSPPKKK